MKWILLAAYCVVLALGLTLIIHRTESENLAIRTTRALPFNHLLQEGDVSPAPWYIPAASQDGPTVSDFIGKYMTGNALSGQALRRDEVASVPMVDTAANQIRIIVPVARDLVVAKVANAGGEVRICGNKSAVLDRVRIAGLLCPSDSKLQCSAIIPLVPGDAEKLLEVSKRGEPAIATRTDKACEQRQ